MGVTSIFYRFWTRWEFTPKRSIASYSASSLGRPLVVITFLHQVYLWNFVYVVCTYFHACSQQSTTEINTQGSWRHFPNTNSCLAVIFLWHHMLQSWCYMARSTTNKCFPGVSSRLDLSMSTQNIKIGRYCFSRKIAKHLCRWAAQQKGYKALCSVLSVTVKRIGWLHVWITLSHTNNYNLLRRHQNVNTSLLPESPE